MSRDWKLPEVMDKVDIPPDCIISYSQVQQLLENKEIDKVFDTCLSIVRDHLVAAALISTRGNQVAAAAKLGITRSALRDYIKLKGQVRRRRFK